MPTPTIDFDKIFSINSPSTLFTWTDLEYLEGWDTIQNTPPTRQQFNALQMISDQKDLELYNIKAPIESPVFTGDPQAPTPPKNDNDTSLATTAFVRTWINDVLSQLTGNGTGVTEEDIAGNGYVKFKNGLIIQWGIAQTNGYTAPVTFPIDFTNTGWAIVGTHITFTGTPTVVCFDGNSKTVSGCIMGIWDILTEQWIDNAAYVIAVGY